MYLPSSDLSRAHQDHHYADKLFANTIGYYIELATISTYMCFEVCKNLSIIPISANGKAPLTNTSE